MENRQQHLAHMKMKSNLKAGAEKLDLLDRAMFALLDALQKPTDAAYRLLNTCKEAHHEN